MNTFSSAKSCKSVKGTLNGRMNRCNKGVMNYVNTYYTVKKTGNCLNTLQSIGRRKEETKHHQTMTRSKIADRIMNTPKHLKGLTYEPNKRSRRNHTKRRLMLILKIVLLPWFLVAMYLFTDFLGFFDWVDRVFESPWVQLGFVLSLVSLSAILYFSRWYRNQ